MLGSIKSLKVGAESNKDTKTREKKKTIASSDIVLGQIVLADNQLLI